MVIDKNVQDFRTSGLQDFRGLLMNPLILSILTVNF
jgi:hypothetical protein